MVVVGLIQEVLVLLNGLLSHFVSGSVSSATLGSDYEWTLGVNSFAITTKGSYLMGAVADIVTYGAILVDWLVQALIGTGLDIHANA